MLFVCLFFIPAGFVLTGWGINQANRWTPGLDMRFLLLLGSTILPAIILALLACSFAYAWRTSGGNVEILADAISRLTASQALSFAWSSIVFLFVIWSGGLIRAAFEWRRNRNRTGTALPSVDASLLLVASLVVMGVGVLASMWTDSPTPSAKVVVFTLAASVGLGRLAFIGISKGLAEMEPRSVVRWCAGPAVCLGFAGSLVAWQASAPSPYVPLVVALCFAFGAQLVRLEIGIAVRKALLARKLN